MAGWMGYTLANELYDFVYRGTSITIDVNLWLRLLVAPSSRSGGGTETSYINYARLQLPRDGSVFGVTSAGQIMNSVQLVFPAALSLGNGDLVAFDVVDTPSGAFAKLYNGGPITPAKAIDVGKNPTFRAGSLIFTL